MLLHFAVVDAGDGDLAYPRDVYLAGTINRHSQVSLELPPNPDLQFIPGAQDVVTRNL